MGIDEGLEEHEWTMNNFLLRFCLVVQDTKIFTQEESWLRTLFPGCEITIISKRYEIDHLEDHVSPDVVITKITSGTSQRVKSLLEELYQHLPKNVPNIIITGKNPSDEVIDLLLGFGPDDILLCPLKKIDLGTSLKLIFRKQNKTRKKIADVEYINRELSRKNNILASRSNKYKYIFEQAPIAILVYDELGKVIDYNRQTLKTLGIDEVELERFSELIQYPTFTNKVEFCNSDSRIARYTTVVDYDSLGINNKQSFAKRGKAYLNIQMTQISAGNSAYLYLVFVADETKKREVEEQNRKLELAVRQSPDPIIITDKSGIIEYVNPEFTRLTGYSFEESIGKKPGLLKSGKKTRRDYEQLWETILAGRVWSGEFVNKKKNGDEYIEDAVISPIFNENGDITHFLGVKKDITDLKEKERALHLLSQAIDQSPISVVVVKNDYTIEYANEKFLKLNNCQREDVIGKEIFKASSFANHILKLDNYAEQLLNGRTVNSEFQYKEADGTISWEKVSISPILNADSQISHFLSIREDITDKKKIEKNLEQERKKAKKLADVKSQFLSNMSHEIRTPLNGIIGLINILINEDPRPEQAEYLELLRFSSDHLLALINNILDLNKIDEGKLRIERNDKDLEFMLVRLLGTYQSKAKERGIRLSLEYSKDLNKNYYFDKTRLTQIISNLLNNAIKFTHEGYVKIKAQLLNRKGKFDDVRIAVSDSGIGIENEKIKLIFDRFTQADVSIVNRYGGSGLGLAITKKLLDLMESSIKVESKVGAGTTFSFVLRLKQGVGYDEIEGFKNIERQIFSKTFSVLSVDDNVVNQMIIQKYVTCWGGQIALAKDGYEALEKIKDKRYNLVFMDVQMPGLNGLKTTREIRKMNHPYFKKVPIIALSASAEQSQKTAAKRVGMDDYLTKPYHPDELKRVIVRFGKFDLEQSDHPGIPYRENKKKQRSAELNKLREQLDEYTLGDKELKIQLITSVRENLNELRKIVLSSSGDKSMESLPKAHHKIRSSMLMLGQDELDLLVGKIVESGKSEDFPGNRPIIEKFNKRLDNLISNLNLVILECRS